MEDKDSHGYDLEYKEECEKTLNFHNSISKEFFESSKQQFLTWLDINTEKNLHNFIKIQLNHHTQDSNFL